MTVRLHNIDPNRSQLSLHLLHPIAKAQPRLRRGVNLLAIKIPPGRYYDICLELGVDLEDARKLALSPEVIAHKNGNRLLVREFPPSDTQIAAEAKVEKAALAAQERTEALNPPDPPGAVPAGVDLELAGLPLDTVRMRAPAPPAGTRPGLQEEIAPATTETEAVEIDDDATSEEVVSEPSMNWSSKRLRKFAEDNNIPLEGAVAKTAMLKAIRKVLNPR